MFYCLLSSLEHASKISVLNSSTYSLLSLDANLHPCAPPYFLSASDTAGGAAAKGAAAALKQSRADAAEMDRKLNETRTALGELDISKAYKTYEVGSVLIFIIRIYCVQCVVCCVVCMWLL